MFPLLEVLNKQNKTTDNVDDLWDAIPPKSKKSLKITVLDTITYNYLLERFKKRSLKEIIKEELKELVEIIVKEKNRDIFDRFYDEKKLMRKKFMMSYYHG